MGSPAIQSLLVMSVFLTKGLSQSQAVVAPNAVVGNQPFTFTCEANRVPSVPSGVTTIASLTISRNVSANDVQVASYAAFSPPGASNNLALSFIPPGRNWTIIFSGNTDAFGSPVGNRNTMKVVLVVWVTRSDDAGIYRCRVNYYPPGEFTPTIADKTVNITTKAPGSDWKITFSGSKNGTRNRHSIKIEVLVPGARYNDTRTYRCLAMFYPSDEGTVWLHQDQCLREAC